MLEATAPPFSSFAQTPPPPPPFAAAHALYIPNKARVTFARKYVCNRGRYSGNWVMVPTAPTLSHPLRSLSPPSSDV